LLENFLGDFKFLVIQTSSLGNKYINQTVL